MDFNYDVHFCWVPLHYLHRQKPEDIHAEWQRKLRDDIEANGLSSPILVSNNLFAERVKQVPYRVLTGMNRLRCLCELEWEKAPCILCGDMPPDVEGTRIHNLEEAQSYLSDGIIAHAPHGFGLRINSAKLPEHMEYPSPKWRYTKEGLVIPHG